MHCRLLGLALVATGLAGCTPPLETTITQVTEVKGANCSVLKLADLPLTVEHGALVVEAAVNGAPVRLIVDTGADSLALSKATVERLHLPAGRGRTQSAGIGGLTVNENAHVDSFSFGGFILRDRTVATVPIKAPVDGLLGATFLSAFDVEIDLSAQRMTLWGSKHCADGFLPWSPPIGTVALGEEKSGRVTLPITVNDQPLTVLFDTGAATSTLTERAAERAGVVEADLAGDKSLTQLGVDGHPVDGHLHRFAKLQIGPATINGAVFAVSPLELGHGLDGLLGFNYLRGRRIWIDYTNRRLYVQPSRVPEPSASPTE
jgi:predicted aspartyl protease